MAPGLADDVAEQLQRACRTAIGDELRSIVYFTADDHDQLYLREDLTPDAELDLFVGNERLGFTSQERYGDTELGEYRYTVRSFRYGNLARIMVGDEAVFVTTDEVTSLERFDDLAEAVREVLEQA